MQGFLHSGFFPLDVFAVTAALAVVDFQLYPSDTPQTGNTDASDTYSFEAPGQLKQQTRQNAFRTKSAEELQLSAIDIMKQADAISF
jgi:hypothetical protein